MMRRNDPRIRQTWNQISQSVESANESAQANIFSFSHNYIGPCLSSFGNCIASCTAPCFPTREERLRRQRGRSRGRAELSFDFYDDWEEDDGARDGLLGWGNDELDRLLAGSSASQQTTGRNRAMSYGARRGKDGRGGGPGTRRKTVTSEGPDSTIIPQTSIFGFLRLPWQLGTKPVRYTPSVADLQEHPGSNRRLGLEGEPLLEENEDGTGHHDSKQARKRSDTQGSGATVDSYSSRGDLFSSEDEADAIPLDDEFAVVLERRMTGSGPDDRSSGRTRSGKRPSAGSRMSTRTSSSRDIRASVRRSREDSLSAARPPSVLEAPMTEAPTLADLNREEEQARHEEEAEIERKRVAAQRLALKQGLSAPQEASDEIESEETPRQESEEAVPNAATPEFVPARLPHFPSS